jgi:hypothetical protein
LRVANADVNLSSVCVACAFGEEVFVWVFFVSFLFFFFCFEGARPESVAKVPITRNLRRGSEGNAEGADCGPERGRKKKKAAWFGFVFAPYFTDAVLDEIGKLRKAYETCALQESSSWRACHNLRWSAFVEGDY